MTVNVSISRQRVPMLDASTLEDRTRPALDGSIAARLRYFSWPNWASDAGHMTLHQARPTQARLGHHQA
jgi:hypothetical protein